MKNTIGVTPAAVFAYWLLAGCSSSSVGVLESAGKAIAPDGIERVNSQRVVATGRRFDHLEGYSSTSDRGYEQLTFSNKLAVDFMNQAQHGDWDSTTIEVFPGTHGSWTEVSSKGQGFVTGQDGGYPPADKGVPMISSRIAARWKELSMMTPALLLQYALVHREQVQELPDQYWNGSPYHVLSVSQFNGWPAPVRLFIDPGTMLLAKSDTIEDDPVYGDALVEFAYDDWRSAGLSQAPFSITQHLAGAVILDERRSEIADNPSLPSNEFSLRSDLQGPQDSALADYGKRSSEYLLRTQEYGAAIYDDLSKYMQPVELAPGLIHYRVGGYNSLAVELATSILVVEAPLYEAASAAVIKDIKTRFPGKPIKYIVSTHFHYDHSGGTRTYAAEGAQVIVPQEAVSFYRSMLASPHTLRPDALARNPKQVLVTGVGDRLSVTEGARTVTMYNISQSHSEGCLVAFVEDAKMLFTSDLFNPGGLGPNPMGPDRPYHDLYARQLVKELTNLGINEMNLTTFVGGHGITGSWKELRIFGGI